MEETAAESRPTEAERAAALNAVLESDLFSRADQLRHFLEYVCREEAAGRGASISEYAIAVEGLGRSASYSPDTDSSVRARASALRKKLEEYYRGEGRNDPWRVELPKGSYRPRLVRAVGDMPPAGPDHGRAHPSWRVGATLGAAIAVAGLAAWLLSVRAQGTVAPPAGILTRVWGDVLSPGRHVTVVVATPVQFLVRSFDGVPLPEGDPPVILPAPSEPRFDEMYERDAQQPARGLMLHPNVHSPLWGDVSGAFIAQRFLLRHGVNAEILPEDNIRAAALRERDAVLLGRADYSPAMRVFEPTVGFAVAYVPEIRQIAIVQRTQTEPGGAAKPATVRYTRGSSGEETFGLVTALRLRSAGGAERRLFLASGLNSDGAQAGIEFLTTPGHLQVLEREFARQDGSGWPAAWQVVVRVSSSDTYPWRVDFADCRRLPHLP